MKKKILFLLAPVLTILSVLLLPSNVSASTVPSTVKYKAAYEGVYQCLMGGATYASFNASSGGAGMFRDTLSGDTVKLPYSLTDAADNNTNCKEILKGFNSDARSDDNLRAGLLQAGMWSETDQLAVKNYFAGTSGNGGAGTMGYKAEGSGNVTSGQMTSKLALEFNPDRINSGTCRKRSGTVTVVGTQSFYDTDGNTYSQLIFPTITKDNTGSWFFGDVSSNSNGINVPKPGSGGRAFYYFCNDDSWIQINDSGTQNSPYYEIYITFTQYDMGMSGTLENNTQPNMNELVTSSGSNGWSYSANSGLFKGTITEDTVEETGDFDDYKLTYLKLDGVGYSSTYMRTITKLSNTSAAGYNLSLNSSSTYDSLKLSDPEIYSLYTYYIKDVFKYPVLCEGDADFSAYNDSNSKKINWASGKTCRIDTAAVTTRPENSVYGINNGTKHFTKEVTIDDVVAALNALPDNVSEQVADGETGGNIPDGTVSGENTDQTTTGSTTSGETSTLALCYQSAGPLGWVICPVIKAVGEATGKLYEFIEDTLQIQANTIMATGGPVYGGWSAFRNFANILFAIAFAVIILAQVTGLGVSNYNIKKFLPRLIMVAVLVNISFVLCQLAVDVSNLVGFSAKQLFDNLTIVGGGNANVSVVDAIGSIASIATAAAATVTIAGVTVTAATLSFWLIPLVVSLFGMLIGVLFFFLTLGARQAGIIVLVILSPVAIVCYALPNTKSLFDRWKKIFWALLLVYPICGVLMGGGNYAGSILLSVAEGLDPGNEPLQLLYAVIGMLITVVPFFMIPSLLKSSMAMMGNLGAKISNFGNGVRGGLTRGIRGSRAFQEHQAEEQRRLNYQRDQTRVGRLSATGKGGGLIGRARRRLGMNDNLRSRQVTSAALAQSNIDRATDTTAQALRARWESDGTANDFEGLTDRYTKATERLFSNPTDRDAIEEQKAAAMLLAAAKPGRGMLRKANNSLGEKIAAMTDEDQKKAAKQVMQRSANNLLRTNSGDIAKSPLLDEQVSSMQNITDTDYGSLNTTALTSSINKINARTMSDMSNADLKDYLEAAASGKLDDDDFATLTTAAQNTLSDPRYQGQIKADARKTLNQLADLRYRRQAKAGASDDEIKNTRTANMASIAGVNDAEFDRIRSRLKSGQMKETDATGVEQDYGTEMMDLMGHALMRTMDANDDFNLSANRATQISQVLQENGYDLSSIAGQYGITDPGQIREKLDVATGMKVPREPRQTLSERHANWQRATEAQASASGGRFAQGEWINTTTGRKLNQKDTMEAELLEKRDLEAQEAVVREKIERDDAAYRRSRTPIPVPPSNPPTPPTPPAPSNP